LDKVLKVLTDPENQVFVHYGKYKEYLETDMWKRKSKALREYYGGCAVCNSIENLSVHHKHYHTLGREGLADVTVICWPCHRKYDDERKAEKAKQKVRMPILQNTNILPRY
jgi:5-methylcytosine-specific restriction endonuclease McrA